MSYVVEKSCWKFSSFNWSQRSYSMGLAYSLQPNYSKAHEFFSKALECIKLKTSKLEARVAEWESKSKGKGKASDKDPCVVDRKELEELQNLYPEIKARVSHSGGQFKYFTPMISSLILLTVFHTILMISVGRIWYWILNFFYSHHLSAWHCIDIYL